MFKWIVLVDVVVAVVLYWRRRRPEIRQHRAPCRMMMATTAKRYRLFLECQCPPSVLVTKVVQTCSWQEIDLEKEFGVELGPEAEPEPEVDAEKLTGERMTVLSSWALQWE